LLIKKTAEILSVAVRTDDIVARIGGDEFAVILPQTDMDAAVTIIARIWQCISEQDKKGLQVSLAIGAGTAIDGECMLAALKDADDRMYQDKAEIKRQAAELSSTPLS
jgi:diguanylate cyclase (GGDEF)-like protein